MGCCSAFSRAVVSAVTSVFGRTGAVVAQVGDYLASQVTNDSGVSGFDVAAALDTLAASISALTAQIAALTSSPPYLWGSVSSTGLTGTRFFLRTALTPGTSEAAGQVVAVRAFTVTGLRVSFGTASPTDSMTITFRLNGAPTALAVTVPATQTSGTAVGSIAVAAGDRLAVSVAQSGTDTVSTWNCSVAVF
jgi:hypothetical protein